MNWTTFQSHEDGPTKSFEVMCNQLFENWIIEKYNDTLSSFHFVNGAGGDGGVESYAVLTDQSIIGLQAKWFPDRLEASQLTQIRKSIQTALTVRPNIKKYIICIPRDLADQTLKKGKTETAKWKSLVNDFAVYYPDLQLELWSETRILSELQKEASAGIYRYWFNKSEITEQAIKLSFEKSKHSWLATKYTPELNTFGLIHQRISEYIGTSNVKEYLLKSINQIIDLSAQALDLLNTILQYSNEYSDDTSKTLLELHTEISDISQKYQDARNWAQTESGPPCSCMKEISSYYLAEVSNTIKESYEYNSDILRFNPLLAALEALSRIDSRPIIQTLRLLQNNIPLLFSGEPGTGKTHGISAVVNELLSEVHHVPVLIQARNIPQEWNWNDIIQNALGLSSWSENETWQGLLSLAKRFERSRLDHSKHNSVFSKVIIIVDGLDESATKQKWIDRINSAQAISNHYPRIKFCFLSRPFVFADTKICGNIVRLSSSGDVPVYQLFDQYIKYYHINVTKQPWIKNVLTTPLALKLFCELNQQHICTDTSPLELSLSTLLQRKIELMEYEFTNQYPNVICKPQIVLNAIYILSKLFGTDKRVKQEDVVKHFIEEIHIGSDNAYTLAAFLEKYGLLRLFCEQKSSLLGLSVYYYYPGIQGYFDYANALLLLEQYTSPDKIDFTSVPEVTQNTLYILSTISISSYSYLLTRNSSINRYINSYSKQELYYFSLRQAPRSLAFDCKQELLEYMGQNANALHEVTNQVILPLSRNPENPLGTSLLEEFLNKFDNPAKRDLYWSVPSILHASENEIWNSSNQLDLGHAEYRLTKEDTYNGLPTIYAWGLSSVENPRRKIYRTMLMKWALLVPNEFFKLFKKFAYVNDPQIRNDIFSILMSMVFEISDDALLKAVSQWLMENILSSNNIKHNRDVAIRYYSVSILQQAISKKLFSSNEVKEYLPPYSGLPFDIPLDKDALNGTSLKGYSGIDYDLSRYVLIDHIKSPFELYTQAGKQQIRDFLRHLEPYGPEFANISMDQFILSAAYAYILKCGWNEEEYDFYEKLPKLHMGIDNAIRRSYSPATHGSQSQVMTICEKYVWQARKYIIGFISENLMLHDEYSDSMSYVYDYSMLEMFLIPALEIQQKSDFSNNQYHWHIPDQDSVIPRTNNYSKEALSEAISKTTDIDWSKWIRINNEGHEYPIESDYLIVLKGYSCFESPANIETNLYIDTILISKEHLDKFLTQISTISEGMGSVMNPFYWDSGIYCQCYISPKEICWMPWKNRYESTARGYFPDILIDSAVDHCTYNYEDTGDASFDIPSAPIRKLLNICNTTGTEFYDKGNKLVALRTSIGVQWKTNQSELLIGENILELADRQGYSIVWIFREDRRENIRARDKYGSFYAEKDKSSIGFFNNNNFEIIPITVISKPGNIRDPNMDRILSKYIKSSLDDIPADVTILDDI